MKKTMLLLLATLFLCGGCSVESKKTPPKNKESSSVEEASKPLSPDLKSYPEDKILEKWQDDVNWVTVDKSRKGIDVERYNFYLPKGFHIHGSEFTHLDFNQDQQMDIATIVENDDEEIKIMILEKVNDGYQLKTQSESFLLESMKITTIDSNTLFIYHQSMRHDFNLRFKYEKEQDDFMLIGSMLTSYGSASSPPETYINDFLKKETILFSSKVTEEDYYESLSPKVIPITKRLPAMKEINDDNVYDFLSFIN